MHSDGLGFLISKAQVGACIAIANDSSNMFPDPESKFTSSKSNCTVLNKWHVISVMWSNKKNLSNCWSNGIKIITFTSGNTKGSDYSFIGGLGRLNDSYNTYLSSCIGKIIGFHRSLTDTETLYIHQYLMRKWGIEPGSIADPIHLGCIIGDQLVLPFYLHFNLCHGVTSCHSCAAMSGNCTIVQSCNLSQRLMQFCFQGPLYYPK